MSITWRLVVLHDGGSSHVYQAESDVLSLDSFDVTPAGDCGEALLTVLGSSVVLPPRAIVTLETSPDGIAWTPRYRGLVVVAASARTLQPQTVKLVGLRQRFYEVTVTEPRVAGDDIAEMAFQVLDSVAMPAGVTLNPKTSFLLPGGGSFEEHEDMPPTGFQLGDRYPQLESVGELLDALAETAPRFVVPPGETYEYGGVTYAEGDVVPPVEWGVRADGVVFFARADPSTVSVDEAAAGVRVEWGQLNAEQVYDQVRIIYDAPIRSGDLDSYNVRAQQDVGGFRRDKPPASFLPIHDVAVPASGAGAPTELRRAVTPPLDLMQPLAPNSTTKSSSLTVTNPGNAWDGNPATFASFSGSSFMGKLYYRWLCTPAAFPAGLRARSGVWVFDALIQSIGAEWTLSVFLESGDGTFPLNDIGFTYRFPAMFDQRLRVELPIVPHVTNREDRLLQAGCSWSTGASDPTMLVYESRYYVPDVTLPDSVSAAFGRALLREPEQEVADVTLYDLAPLRTSVAITPTTGATVTIPVELIEYRVTTSEGVTTTYHAGQRFAGELESQRVVLERLAQRAAARRERSRAS